MSSKTQLSGREIYIVDGCRTPFLKAKGQRGSFSAADLAVRAGRQLLLRQPFKPTDVDEVITGCVMPAADEANISRIAALRLGCGDDTPAWTVQRNCASGMQALDSAAKDIIGGRADLVMAGGVEAMSHAPLLLSDALTNWLSGWYAAKTTKQRWQQLRHLKLHYLKPTVGLLKGLSDPVVGLSMGQTAEKLAYKFDITRTEMDKFALGSHQRLAEAYEQHHMGEVMPVYTAHGDVYSTDTGLRRDTDLNQLAKLKPFFDKPFGAVTAGNSSQVTDGGVYLILASKRAVRKYQLPVMGRLVDVQWAANDPSEMGLGPIHAATPLLQRHQLSLDNINYWEINEAFAAQVIACARAWQDAAYCQQYLNLSAPMGELDFSRVNVDGGAIAIGHPVGASGARIVYHLLTVLKRKQAQRGIACICIGGGQGGAMLVENIVEPIH
jgi:acetyl-CoA C-acetyltransferase